MSILKWGLIGASTIAREWMVEAISQNEGCEIEAIMSSDATRARDFAKNFSIPHHYHSLSDFLNNDQIDIVYISTTNELHFDQAIQTAKAGKHLLCEKPLAMNVDQATEMVDTFKKNQLVLGTNHHLRNAATHRKIKELIDEGTIGDIKAIRVLHASYLPEKLQAWRIKDKKKGGGVALDMTVHDVDCVRFLSGKNPVSVIASSQNSGMAEDDLSDGLMSVVSFEGGIQVFMHESFTIKYAGSALEIHGSEGSIIGRNIMKQIPQGEVFLVNGEGEQLQNVQHENMYLRAVGLFNKAVKGAGKVSATGEDGLWSLATAVAAEQSSEQGKEIQIITIQQRSQNWPKY